MARPRFDNLAPGSYVLLQFYGPDSPHEPAVFLGVTGEGNDREAHFAQTRYWSVNDVKGAPVPAAEVYEWAAYRFQGRWAYGSGADTLRLVSVLAEVNHRGEVVPS